MFPLTDFVTDRPTDQGRLRLPNRQGYASAPASSVYCTLTTRDHKAIVNGLHASNGRRGTALNDCYCLSSLLHPMLSKSARTRDSSVGGGENATRRDATRKEFSSCSCFSSSHLTTRMVLGHTHTHTHTIYRATRLRSWVFIMNPHFFGFVVYCWRF